MSQDREEQIKACVRELAKLLYEEADKSQLTDLESIEKKVRSQILDRVSASNCVVKNTDYFAQL